MLCSCEFTLVKYDDRLSIRNDSERNIYYCESLDYPDTSLILRDIKLDSFGQRIEMKKSKVDRLTNSTWEGIFRYLKSDTLILFILDAEMVETVPWDTIRKNYEILMRYDLSFNDIQRLNWKIVFPPTDTVKLKVYRH